MLEARPGAFIFIGNGDSAGLHHPPTTSTTRLSRRHVVLGEARGNGAARVTRLLRRLDLLFGDRCGRGGFGVGWTARQHLTDRVSRPCQNAKSLTRLASSAAARPKRGTAATGLQAPAQTDRSRARAPSWWHAGRSRCRPAVRQSRPPRTPGSPRCGAPSPLGRAHERQAVLDQAVANRTRDGPLQRHRCEHRAQHLTAGKPDTELIERDEMQDRDRELRRGSEWSESCRGWRCRRWRRTAPRSGSATRPGRRRSQRRARTASRGRIRASDRG